MEYKKSSKDYKKPETAKENSENLLEQVLSNAKPLVSSTEENKYSFHERPTELSSFGYADYSGDDPSD